MPRELTQLPVFHTPKPPARRRWLVLAACALAGCIGWSGITAAPADTGPSGGIKAEDILPPERAFPVRSVRGASGSSSLVTLQWDIAPGYYLYRSRFRFEPADPWLQIGGIDFPRGESKHDEFFGRQEIYRGRLVIPLHATFSADQPATLVVTTQAAPTSESVFPRTRPGSICSRASRLPRAAQQSHQNAPRC